MSEKMKFTPGPWEYTPYTDQIRADHSRHWTIADMVEMQGCADPLRDIVAEEKIANARLIAAAPDLLEALIELKEWIENDCGAECPSGKAESAISKAEGKDV